MFILLQFYFFIRFEQVFCFKVFGVFFLFWDLRLEVVLENFSVILFFIDELMGFGNGVVKIGYFVNWSYLFVGDLVRNVGNFGEFIQKRDIERFFKVRYMKEFMFLLVYFYMNLEFIYGKVYMWVSGMMNNFNYFFVDLIFWMYYCFIDYVWEKI